MCPAAAMSAAIDGHRRTCSPTRKKLARAPAAARTSRTAGVPRGCGPSSNVSATTGRSGAIVRAMPSGRHSDGTSGAAAGSDQAAAAAIAAVVARGAGTAAMVARERAPMIGGVPVAIAAACCYETAYVLQALEARRVERGQGALRPSLLARLVRRRRWVLGTLLAGVGAGLQVLALTLVPLTVVQPTLALGLVLLLALAAVFLGEPVGRRELAGVGAVVAGVTLVAFAAPDVEGSPVDPAGTAALLGVLAVVALLPFASRRLHDPRLRVAAAAAGDVWAAIALKLVADAAARGAWGQAAVWAVGAAVFGLAALNAEMSALQQLAATHVAPVVVAAQVLLPVLAAPLVLGESWSGTPLGGGLLAGAVALVTAGAAVLGASPPVADTIAAADPAPAGGDAVEDDVRRQR